MKYVRGRIFAPEIIYGKSAYEIAILHGYEGTEEEWLASLADEANRIAMESAASAEKSAEEAKETAEELNAIYGDIDTALDSIIAVQEALIEGGADIPVISGVYRFNERAESELGISATLPLEKTNVNFTASDSDVQFTAIYSSDCETAYWDSDGRQYHAHESGMFDNGGYGDVLDFGTRWQVVTAEFLAWVDYYMEKVG